MFYYAYIIYFSQYDRNIRINNNYIALVPIVAKLSLPNKPQPWETNDIKRNFDNNNGCVRFFLNDQTVYDLGQPAGIKIWNMNFVEAIEHITDG